MPAKSNRWERSPTVAGGKVGGAVTTQRIARNVLVAEVVTDLSEQRQQSVLAAGAEYVLRARIA